MSEPNPPRRPLATFLRTAPGADAAPADATGHAAPQLLQEGEAAEDDQDTAPSLAQHEEPVARADVDVDRAESDTMDAAVASEAPSFLGMRPRARPSPRWHWALVAGLALLLVLQSVLADRARLAADAGHRPWISALCGVLRCSLPAWREPTAFTMTSREIRPLPGQAGVLQVQASIRNDARWAQAWPDLRLSLSDADGRLIGSGVFTPAQYLGEDPAATLEPGQSARVAFRVQEPAASTVAFTFEFL
ncbi:DUF3426 domain-containing protein [Stenotrophomonas sp. ZAC14D2_NAIMI4_7]|uniref:DUF3426 domain-containing protein n=1 Tax=Stenotrophomonas sp. ZAC14D2_NAIMI4_7 TaxID=2072405 RepID=UPI000D54046F|nr:DUF3426 domain-containing protein [Stenotrophomonas sp. ZAC14D2_NAIMI4_7]AWH19070.1 DUF3426 domain-containing protein [Stenotrophomonas sp. ZAC14D2_NAIMI4_7]